MPRKRSMRRELEETGILTNEFGIEVARLTINGILVLNYAEVFFEATRWASTHGGKCTFNHLCREFSATGSWGYDPAVYAACYELERMGVAEIVEDRVGNKSIRPTVSPNTALRILPPYTTRAEVHAGLEELDND